MYKTVTLICEVYQPNVKPDWYTPEQPGFRFQPRTREGVKNALRALERNAQYLSACLDYRVKLYEGRKGPFIGELNPSEIRAFWKG